jgi:hypothetical protein
MDEEFIKRLALELTEVKVRVAILRSCIKISKIKGVTWNQS